jgi:hypothetical protein
MPYEKAEGTKKGYTGLNLLKNGWRRILDHVDSTPAQMTFATVQLEYLCAETQDEKNLKKLALVSQYGARLGYRMPLDTKLPLNEPDLLDGMVSDMLKLASKKEG